jgi:hypothetical protein
MAGWQPEYDPRRQQPATPPQWQQGSQPPPRHDPWAASAGGYGQQPPQYPRRQQLPPVFPPGYSGQPDQQGHWPPPRQPPPAPRPSPPRASAAKGCAMLGCGGAAAVFILVAVLVSHGSSGSPSAGQRPAAAPAQPAAAVPAAGVPARSAAAKAAPSPPCKLKDTPTYIVRDDDPGASVLASDIGNADYVTCTTALADFAATAGQASGECTTIALASDNPGYNVNAVPAPPLKGVIESAGPGCSS